MSTSTTGGNAKVKKIIFGIVAVFFVLTLCVLFEKRANLQEDTYNISAILPLTGNFATDAGNNIKNALTMCVEHFNTYGGVNGKKIKIEFYDAKNASAREAVDITNRLISTKENDIIIAVISGIVMAINPILEQNKILNMAIASTSNLFDVPKNYTLRTHLSAKQTGNVIADTIKNEFKASHVKIIYSNDEFGNTSKQAFLDAAQERKISADLVSYEEKELSYRQYILKLNLDDSDIIYVIGAQEFLGRLVKQIKEYGFQGKIIGGPDLNTESAKNIMGDDKSNVYFIETKRCDNFAQFNQEFKKRFSVNVDEISMLSYTGLSTILKCLNEIGTNDIDELMSNINGYKAEEYLGFVTFAENEMIVEFEISRFNQ